MSRAWSMWMGFVLASACGSEECVPLAARPLSESQAKLRRPEIDSGLAVSTSRNYGPCSSNESCEGQRCGLVRQSLRVLVVEGSGVSIPVEERCSSGLSVEKLGPLAVLDEETNADGEGLWALSPGLYWFGVEVSAPSLSSSVRCLSCGGARCRFEVQPGRIEVRNLSF